MHEALALAEIKHVPRGPKGPWFYAGDLAGYKITHANGLSQDDLDGWLEDVPF